MSAPLQTLATLLLVPVLVPSGIEYAPQAGTTLQTHLESEQRTEFTSLVVRMGGQEVPSVYLPKIDMQLEMRAELDVLDQLHKVVGGRCQHLERSFEKLQSEVLFEMSMEGPQPMSQQAEGEGESQLEGKSVEYRWDDSQEEYVAAWAKEESASPEILEESWLDLSLAGLLADEDVEVGASWTADAQVLSGVLFFENGPYMELDGSGDGAERLTSKPDEFEGPKGDLEVRLEKLYEEDDQALALLTIEGEFETWESLATNLDAIPVANGDATEETTTVYELEGRLIWDVEQNRAVQLDLSAELERTAITVKDGASSVAEEYESEAVMQGTATWSLTTRGETL